MKQLGDSHNFGRRVTQNGTRIRKPRTLLWEWLLLAKNSPLRRFLREAAARDGLGPDAFGFLLELKFFGSKGPAGGEVERAELTPLPTRSNAQSRAELAQVAGKSLALWSWLGVSDLHWENLVLGIGERERVVFSPLDIEMILADLDSPTATKLLPDADPEYAEISRHACGIRRVLPVLGKPVDAGDLLTMVSSYRRMLAFLDRHAIAIAAIFSSLPQLHETPIRVCLRGTEEYVRARSAPLWPPLLDAEAEQLARGDIPYFFQLYGRRGIHYYGDRSLKKIVTLPLAGDTPQPDPILKLSRNLKAPSRKKLREEGLFTLLGAFDHTELAGTHTNDDIEVRFGARTLTVKLSGGEELSSRRNLRAFVNSVYLPCRCGEVRTVFVPTRTVCRNF